MINGGYSCWVSRGGYSLSGRGISCWVGRGGYSLSGGRRGFLVGWVEGGLLTEWEKGKISC